MNVHDLDWHEKANCRVAGGKLLSLFFPVSRTAFDAGPARELCSQCPVTEECWAWAVASNQDYGIWGGRSEIELNRATGRRPRARPQGEEVSLEGHWWPSPVNATTYKRGCRCDGCRQKRNETEARLREKRRAQEERQRVYNAPLRAALGPPERLAAALGVKLEEETA